MSSIFLSHSHKDKAFARKLSERLQAHGVRTWIDEAEMQVGDSLLAKIEKAIHDFSYLGVILSPDSLSSEWVQREVSIALTQEIQGRRVKVLPILYKKSEIPGFLATKIYADLTEDFEEGFEKLLVRLRSDLYEEQYKQKRSYDILQSTYQDWISFGRREQHLLKREDLELIMQNIGKVDLSIDLLEYILCSLSLLSLADISTDRFKVWVTGLNQNEIDNLFERVLSHPNFRVRAGAAELIQRLDEKRVLDKLIAKVRIEDNRLAKVGYLRSIYRLNAKLPEPLAYTLLEAKEDWQIQSYALLSIKERRACLLISDETDFALQLGVLADRAGFRVIGVSTQPMYQRLDEIEDDILQAYDMVLLVRGEHFSQGMNSEFYKRIMHFVSQGGALFATSWVGWETKFLYWFVGVLPFIHIRDTYNEDVVINCKSTESDLSQLLFPKTMTYRTSFELLHSKGDSIVLLETEDKIPIFGYHHFGHGICYYFNTCQHLCLGTMPSPFRNNTDLYDCFQNVLKWIYDTSKKALY